jgi:hypothetical protein
MKNANDLKAESGKAYPSPPAWLVEFTKENSLLAPTEFLKALIRKYGSESDRNVILSYNAGHKVKYRFSFGDFFCGFLWSAG